jgi:filamentation induced by cAMP protein fic
MNYILLAHKLPPVVIKSSDKQNYLHALHLADTGQFEAFIRYIAQQVVSSLEMAIKAAKGESIEDPDDLDKEIALLARQLQHQETYKTPQQVLNVFHWVQQKLIAPCEAVLQKFDKLFQEKKKIERFNDIQVDFSSLTELPKEVNSLTYEYCLNQRYYIKNDTPFKTTIEIQFQEKHYELSIKIVDSELFKESYRYGSFPIDKNISSLVEQLGKELLAKVKEV